MTAALRLPHHLMSAVCAVFLATSFASALDTQPLFDLSAQAANPFPTDRYTVPDDSNNTRLRVNLQKPAECAVRPDDSDCVDIDAINTLDGFNLQPRLSIPFSGPIDPTSINSETVFLVSLGDTVTGRSRGTRIGINQVVWDPETNTVHVESDELLDQHTRYLLIVTRDVLDIVGDPIEAAGAFQSFRHGRKVGQRDDDPGVTAYRDALVASLDNAAIAGIDLNGIAVASVFTTQSITAVLEQIRDQIKAASPEPANFLLGQGGTRTVFPVSSLSGMTFQRQLRTDPTDPNFISSNNLAARVRNLKENQNFPGAVGQLAFGKYLSPDYLTCPSTPECDRFIPPVGTRTGIPQVHGTNDLFFTLFLPSGEMPRSGWPLVIYGMGSGDNKEFGPYLVAPALAARGIALIVINAVGQGFGPLSTLTVSHFPDAQGNVETTFFSGGRSFDQNGDGVFGDGTPLGAGEGGGILPPGRSISRRDTNRETVVDLMQLARVIEVGVDVDGNGMADLDPDRIYFGGWSLGAIYGTMFVAIDPLVQAAVLTAGGGGTIELLRHGPLGNRSEVGRWLDKRVPSILIAPELGIANLAGITVGAPHFNENVPVRNGLPLTVAFPDGTSQIIQSPVVNTVAGAMDIQRVIDNTQWVLQSNDPNAYASHLRKNPLDGVPPKPVIVQFASGDMTVPNPSTTALLRAGELADRTTFFRNDLAFAASPKALTKNPHQFAIRLQPAMPTPEMTAILLAAQRQMAEFFASDGTQMIDPDGPCPGAGSGCLFEVPIDGLLPETLGFIP